MPKKQNKLTSESLKNELWGTLQSLKNGTTNTQKGNAIAASARAICSVVKLELQVQKMLGQKPNASTTKFIT